MKKILYSLLLCLTLVFSTSFQVQAANPLTLSPPSYYVQDTATNFEYEIPWSGYYNLELAGARGGTYGATAGNGILLKQTVWLEKGDIISGTTAQASSYLIVDVGSFTVATSGTLTNNTTSKTQRLIVNGGTSSSLYLNGTLYAKAAGGIATTKSIASDSVKYVTVGNGDNTVTSSGIVHWHDGSSSAQGGCYTVENRHYHSGSTSGGGCYTTPNGHAHTGSCPESSKGPDHTYYSGSGYDSSDQTGGTCSKCGRGLDSWENGGGYKTWRCPNWAASGGYECGNSPVNRYSLGCGKSDGQLLGWKIGCGYDQGEISPVLSVSSQASSNPNGMIASTSSSAEGYFKIQLAEHYGLKYGSTVNSVIYNNRKWNVVVNNDTVVFCKHGNLN